MKYMVKIIICFQCESLLSYQKESVFWMLAAQVYFLDALYFVVRAFMTSPAYLQWKFWTPFLGLPQTVCRVRRLASAFSLHTRATQSSPHTGAQQASGRLRFSGKPPFLGCRLHVWCGTGPPPLPALRLVTLKPWRSCLSRRERG